jgi:aminoglycoside phosphotransferase (APT) family kinase protein
MEYSLLGILHHHKIPVPLPVFLDAQGVLFGNPTLVLLYLEGELDFSDQQLVQRIENLAQIVAKLHSIKLDRVTSAGVPALGLSLEKLIGKNPKNPDPFINENTLRSTLVNHWPPQHGNQDALLHGDIWNGNLLWQGTRLSGIIDWEDAWIGDPLLDVAGIRLDLACEFGMQYADLFTSFYANMQKIDLHSLPLWDLVASLWFTRFINEEFVDHPGFFDQYNRPDLTIDRFRAVTREFSQNAIRILF